MTIIDYQKCFTKHCGIKYSDVITVRDPNPDMPAAYCIVVASNLSKQSKVPCMDIVEKAKEFLGTKEGPKWYYVVKA